MREPALPSLGETRDDVAARNGEPRARETVGGMYARAPRGAELGSRTALTWFRGGRVGNVE